jgi:hypothetical protein
MIVLSYMQHIIYITHRKRKTTPPIVNTLIAWDEITTITETKGVNQKQ